MLNRRITFLLHGLLDNLKLTEEGIEKSNIQSIKQSQNSLPSSFNNIDWVFLLFNDIKKEYSSKNKIFRLSLLDIDKLINIIMLMRSAAHLNYDINYVLLDEEFSFHRNNFNREKTYKDLTSITGELKRLLDMLENEGITNYKGSKDNYIEEDLFNCNDENYLRLLKDIRCIKVILYKINSELIKIRI
jgi:hypothetical protein